MRSLYDNAIKSISLGIEDFENPNDDRILSAARNYYAGVLLLGKQCLLQSAPEADKTLVIGAKFQPKLNAHGGVDFEPEGRQTVDFQELKRRFKSFGLSWPSGDIEKLKKLRNDLEHDHLREPHAALREAIAQSFSIVSGFFDLLGQKPTDALPEAWKVMLDETKFFEEQKLSCNKTFEKVKWHASDVDFSKFTCPACDSSLIAQKHYDNTEAENIEAVCRACGDEFEAKKFLEYYVEKNYGNENFVSVKDGGEGVIFECPECSANTYVLGEGEGGCALCGFVLEERSCAVCGAALTLDDYADDRQNLCSYHDYVWKQDD